VTMRFRTSGGDAPLRRYYTSSDMQAIKAHRSPLVGAPNEGRYFFEVQNVRNAHDPISLDYQAARGLIEVIPEVSEVNDMERTDTIIVDMDPKNPKLFGMEHLKWTTKAVYAAIAVKGGPVDANFKIEKVKLRFSGNRSFHIYLLLQKRYPFEDIRKALKEALKPLTDAHPFLRYQNMKTTKAGPPRDDFILIDIGAMSRHRCVRSLYSLHHKTGLVCVPVADIDAFEMPHSKVDHVLSVGPVQETF